MINSISAGIGANYNNGKLQNNTSTDEEIKILQDQKSQIEKQIENIKNGNAQQKIKDELIKPLEDEIDQIDAEIQQSQIEKIKCNTNTSANKNPGLSNNSDVNNDTLLLDNANMYNDIKAINSLRTSLKSSSNSLREEANLDEARDTTHSKREAIAKKRAAASEDDGRANAITSEIYKNSARISKNEKNEKKSNKESADGDSQKENTTMECQKTSINTLA
jgi:hypothetical protein